MFIFKEKVLPVNSEVLVCLKNVESPAGCMKADHQAYFLNFLLLDVASVSWDISSDFLNRASHILQIQPSSLNAYAFLTKV
jgi:hypothetical protein